MKDLVALDDAVRPAGNTSQDSMVNAAAVFEQQLEQMTAWKHQLASQMEVLRRDGIKILERQKNLAIEKKKLADERAALQADRDAATAQLTQLEREREQLDERTEGLERAQGELAELQKQKRQWQAEAAAAQHAAVETGARRDAAAAELKQAETKLAAFNELDARRTEVEKQTATAREELAALLSQKDEFEKSLHDLLMRSAEVAAGEKCLQEREAKHLSEDVRIRETIEQLEAERQSLAEAQRQLMQERSTLAEAAEQKSADVTALQKELEGERAALVQARADMSKRLEQTETEHAEQLELLAKQTKRLSERRAELEAATSDVQKAIELRVGKASEALQEELKRQQASYEQKLAAYEQKFTALATNAQQGDAEVAEWKSREQELLAKSTAAEAEAEAARADLARLQANLNRARMEVEERLADTTKIHAAELERARQESEQLLTAAQHQAAEADERIAVLSQEISALQKKSQNNGAEQGQVAELQAKLTDAEAHLAQALADWDAQTAEWKGKVAGLTQELAAAQSQLDEGTPVADADTGHEKQLEAQLAELMKQLQTMQAQRNELATQLFASHELIQRANEEKMLDHSALEARLFELQKTIETMEAEKSRWTSQAKAATPATVNSAKGAAQHERLLRQARNLRAYRKQVRDTCTALEGHRAEVAQQRDQLRSRKENLEQVKRLLEKQEMVMARKLADHNALKTVAAVGIFVIMVLGSVFLSVYKFVSPEFRSEAVVQLAPPPGLQGVELQAWQTRTAEFARNNEVTYAAWKILRGPDEKYAMHDVRDEWIGSLARQMVVQLDPQSKTVAIRYSGTDPAGVAQVCNALAIALTNPAFRETTDQTRSIGAGGTILARATPPQYPAQDNRLMLGLAVVAVVLFVSLIFVILFRWHVSRQLKEIDQMADEQDLADMESDLPPETA